MNDPFKHRPLLVECLEHRIAMATDVIAYAFSISKGDREYIGWVFKDIARSVNRPSVTFATRMVGEGEGPGNPLHGENSASNPISASRESAAVHPVSASPPSPSNAISVRSNAPSTVLPSNPSMHSTSTTLETTVQVSPSMSPIPVSSLPLKGAASLDRDWNPPIAPTILRTGPMDPGIAIDGNTPRYESAPLSTTIPSWQPTADVGANSWRSTGIPRSSTSSESTRADKEIPWISDLTKVQLPSEAQTARTRRTAIQNTTVNAPAEPVSPSIIEAFVRQISSDDGHAELITNSPNPSLQPILGTIDGPLASLPLEDSARELPSHREAVLAVVEEWESQRPPRDSQSVKQESTTWATASSIAAMAYVVFMFKKRKTPATSESTRIRRPRKPR